MTTPRGKGLNQKKRPRQPTVSDITHAVYVAYPPDPFMVEVDELDSLPNTYVSSSDPNIGMVEVCFKNFQETGDPLMALETLMAAHRVKVYPPIEVLEMVARHIHEYIEGDGNKTLEQCFGLQKGGRKRKPRTEQRLREKYFNVCLHIVIWQETFALQLKHAIHVAALIFGCSAKTIEKYNSHAADHPEWREVMWRTREYYHASYRARYFETDGGRRAFVSQYALDDLKSLKIDDCRIQEDVLRYHKDFN